MKKACPLFFGLLILILVFNGCHDIPSCQTCEKFSDCFVIGFDPCTGVANPNGGNVGFVIRIVPQKDTAVTYNIPSGIYTFPPEYFKNFQYYSFFPDSALEDFPIKIKYRYAKQNERKYPLCRGDILTGYFNQDNQIIILSITK